LSHRKVPKLVEEYFELLEKHLLSDEPLEHHWLRVNAKLSKEDKKQVLGYFVNHHPDMVSLNLLDGFIDTKAELVGVAIAILGAARIQFPKRFLYNCQEVARRKGWICPELKRLV
jgi:hypothetical protein